MAKATARTKKVEITRTITDYVDKPVGVTLELDADEAVLVAALTGSVRCNGVANRVYDALNAVGYGAGEGYNWSMNIPTLSDLEIVSKITGATINN